MLQGNEEIESYSWLLAAVMQALCHPSVKLNTIIPIANSTDTIESITPSDTITPNYSRANSIGECTFVCVNLNSTNNII